MSDCFNCRGNAVLDALPDRERIVVTDFWRVAHAFDTALPGWLVLTPRKHVLSLDELPAEAAAELGVLLHRLTSALKTELGASKTYVMLFAEAEGFAHLHVHLVPRMPDQPDSLRGPAIFGYLGVPPEEQVSEADRDALARRLAARLDVA